MDTIHRLTFLFLRDVTGAVLREVASHGKTMRLEKFEVKNIEQLFYLKVLLERCHTLGSHPAPIVQFFLTLFKRPLVLNLYVANFFERYLKKCVNACHDKIRQNNA